MPDWLKQDLAAIGNELATRQAIGQVANDEGPEGSQVDPSKVLLLMHENLARLKLTVERAVDDVDHNPAPDWLRGKLPTYKAGLSDIRTGVDMQLSFWMSGNKSVILPGGKRIDSGVAKLAKFGQSVIADAAKESKGNPSLP